MQRSKVPQFEGAMALKWNDVLKSYRKHFEDITHDGGWASILGTGDEEEEVFNQPPFVCAWLLLTTRNTTERNCFERNMVQPHQLDWRYRPLHSLPAAPPTPTLASPFKMSRSTVFRTFKTAPKVFIWSCCFHMLWQTVMSYENTAGETRHESSSCNGARCHGVTHSFERERTCTTLP